MHVMHPILLFHNIAVVFGWRLAVQWVSSMHFMHLILVSEWMIIFGIFQVLCHIYAWSPCLDNRNRVGYWSRDLGHLWLFYMRKIPKRGTLASDPFWRYIIYGQPPRYASSMGTFVCKVTQILYFWSIQKVPYTSWKCHLYTLYKQKVSWLDYVPSIPVIKEWRNVTGWMSTG